MKTTKQRVKETILYSSTKAKVGRKTMYVLPHKAILNLSESKDSATRRLREMAQAFGSPAITHQGDNIVIEPKFVTWLNKQ
jgi:hypothetical protein